MNHAHKFYTEYLALRAKVKAQILTTVYAKVSVRRVQGVDKNLEHRKNNLGFLDENNLYGLFDKATENELMDLVELYIELRDSSSPA